jgi:hypothetical protein
MASRSCPRWRCDGSTELVVAELGVRLGQRQYRVDRAVVAARLFGDAVLDDAEPFVSENVVDRDQRRQDVAAQQVATSPAAATDQPSG